MLRSSFLFFLVGVVGCAGGRVATPVASEHIEGRIVESIVLQDSSTVWFDRWESASPGRDKHARVRGEYVEGYVDGAFRRFGISDILELKLGVDDSTRTVTIVSITTVLIMAGVFVGLFFYALSTIEFE